MSTLNDYMFKYYKSQVNPSTGDNVDVPEAVALAEAEIFNTYGDEVSVSKKKKTLIKFGLNSDVDTASIETVWSIGGNEVYPTSNLIDTVSSSDAGDNQVIRIEGHTVSGTGEDAQYTFVVQDATLNGQNKVTLSTPLARVSRGFNTEGEETSGTVHVYEDTAISGGVPTDASKRHLEILTENQQSMKCATTFSNTDYFIMTAMTIGVRRAQAATVDFYLEVREVGGVFKVKKIATTANGLVVPLDPYLIIPKNADVRVRVETSANNTGVSASFSGYLAVVCV